MSCVRAITSSVRWGAGLAILGYQRICKYKFWAVMNSLYSDYGKSLGKTNITPEIYGELTKDWIEDEDAVTEKAAAYYTYVVEHN